LAVEETNGLSVTGLLHTSLVEGDIYCQVLSLIAGG